MDLDLELFLDSFAKSARQLETDYLHAAIVFIGRFVSSDVMA